MKSDNTAKEKFPLGRFFAWKTRDISLGCMVIILGYLSLYASTELETFHSVAWSLFWGT